MSAPVEVNSFYETGSFGPTARVPGYYRGVAVVSPAERFLSAFIDLIPLIPMQFLVLATLDVTAGGLQFGALGWILSLLMIAYVFGNHVALVALRGQTLGKMALGHHIVHTRYDDSGWWFTKMNWKLAWLRGVARLLDIVWLPLSILKIIITRRSTAICDTVVNTIVIPYHYYWDYIPNERYTEGYSDREG